MHAVIRTGGNQYRIEPGDEIDIEKLGDVEAGEEVTFDEVLAVGDGADLDVGRPTIDDAEVVAEVVEHGRGDKKIVFKKKTKQGYRRKHGHRQPYTKVEITDVRT